MPTLINTVDDLGKVEEAFKNQLNTLAARPKAYAEKGLKDSLKTYIHNEHPASDAVKVEYEAKLNDLLTGVYLNYTNLRSAAAEEAKRKQEEVTKQAAEAEAEEVSKQAEEAKRQQEELAAKAEEAKRQQEELAAKAEEKRQQEELAAKAEEAKRQQEELAAKAEEKRQQEELAAKAEEAKRQHDAKVALAVGKMASYLGKTIIAVEGIYQATIDQKECQFTTLNDAFYWETVNAPKAYYTILDDGQLGKFNSQTNTWEAVSKTPVSSAPVFIKLPSTAQPRVVIDDAPEQGDSSTTTLFKDDTRAVPGTANALNLNSDPEVTSGMNNQPVTKVPPSKEEIGNLFVSRRSKAVIISAIVLAVLFGLTGAAILIFSHGVAAPLLYALGALIVNNIGFALPLAITSLTIAGLALSALAAETLVPQSVKSYFKDVFTLKEGIDLAKEWGEKKDLKSWQKPFAYAAGFVYGSLKSLATPVISLVIKTTKDADDVAKPLFGAWGKIRFDLKKPGLGKAAYALKLAWNKVNEGLIIAVYGLIIWPVTLLLFPGITLYRGARDLGRWMHEGVKSHRRRKAIEHLVEHPDANPKKTSSYSWMSCGRKTKTVAANEESSTNEVIGKKSIWQGFKDGVSTATSSLTRSCRKSGYERA